MLRVDGYDVWIDDDLLAHRSFADTIEEQLRAADAVVVVWSSDAVLSDWVRSEANRGREAGNLVQVRVDGCVLPMPFDQIHCIDLSAWSRDYAAPAWRSVMASLAALTGGRAAASPRISSAAGGGRVAMERRQVTALHCALKDAASLSARLDPEDMLQIAELFQMTCDDVITQHGGALAKHMDHGVLAYFGYPRADEEEGANAVRAGLALCEAIGALNLPPDMAIRASVGVATGLVVIQGGGAHEPSISGEPPSQAAQLAALAPSNAVVVAETTRRITEGMFAYQDLGGAILAGQQVPAQAFQVLEATHVASRSQARAGGANASLFGRSSQLGTILECWASARDGLGQIVLVQGEAGIGKSRLVDAFRQHLDDGGGAQTTWFCGPKYSASALHPIVERLERASDFERGDSAETRVEKLAGLLASFGAGEPQTLAVLADLLGLPATVEALTPERRRAVILETLLGVMERLSSRGPALFVIEDLHWADPTTLDLLSRAIQMAVDRPWLILATARPEFECPWFDLADVAHIQLARLERLDAEAICADVDADGLLPPEVVRQIAARGDGNPLFVEEITKSVLETIGSAATPETLAQLAIPNTLQDSLVARLDRLGSAKQVARIAAAIGRNFSYELIAAVAQQPAPELRQALRELVKSGLVDCTGLPPNSRYIFRHALVCDAAYETLPKRQREALHGQIAVVLREQFPDTVKANPALLADHLTRSGATAEAIPLWAGAGQQAASGAAHLEAVGYLTTALELLRRGPRDPASVGLELQLLIGLAVSLSAARGYSVPEVATVLAEARAICDALGNVAGLFVVLRGLCAFSIVTGDLAVAEELARRCLEIGQETGQIEHRIEGDCPLGYILWAKGDMVAARLHLDRAAELYLHNDGARLPQITPQDALIQCLGPLQIAAYAMGDDAGAAKAARTLIAHARSFGESFNLVFGLFWHALFAFVAGDFVTALNDAEEAIGVCDRCGYSSIGVTASQLRAFAIGALGDPERALELAQGSAVELDRLGQVHARPFYVGEIGLLHAKLGDVAMALQMIDSAIATALRHGEGNWLSPLYRRRAEILAGQADVAANEVEAALQAAIDVAAAQGATRFAEQALALRLAPPPRQSQEVSA